jgi:DNA-binding phage protein
MTKINLSRKLGLGRQPPQTTLKNPQFALMLGLMTGTFRIREIAAQAGLSQATVDRVLHQRGGPAYASRITVAAHRARNTR